MLFTCYSSLVHVITVTIGETNHLMPAQLLSDILDYMPQAEAKSMKHLRSALSAEVKHSANMRSSGKTILLKQLSRSSHIDAHIELLL